MWPRVSLVMSMCLLACGTHCSAATLASNLITGTNPNTANPYTAGQSVFPGLTFSGIGRGTGISGTNANDRYNANGWNTAGIDLNDYFYFEFTPNAGNVVSYDNFVYVGQASGTGPSSFAFRSSVDNFSSNIGSPATGGATITLGGPSFTAVATPVTFRLYGWGASASGGTFSVNEFTFNGSVAPVVSAVPEPISFVVLGGLFGVAGITTSFRNRKKVATR